jgi:hypothetical protein
MRRFQFLTRRLTRWADSRLTRETERLQTRVAELESRLKLADMEMATLAAINARDLKRVQAETAIASRKIADAEGRTNVAAY